MRDDAPVPTDDPFLTWGRAVVNATADRLEGVIDGAHRGNESHLDHYEALYVHLVDAKVPMRFAIWLFAARAGSANSVRGYGDAIGIGLLHDPDTELNPAAFRFRRLSPWRWQTHVDTRYAGFRLMRNADELPDDPAAAADEISNRILRTLRAAEVVRQAV